MISAGHIAAVRFGLGPRPDQPPPPGGPEEARAALLAQLAAPPDQAMPPRDWEQDPTLADGLTIQQIDTRNPLPPGTPNRRVSFYLAEAEAYFARLIATPTPFRERLVAFWANHFTVSRREGAVFVLVGDYIRSAIRPHVTGSFADLLKAAIRHPAMLLYLNQSSSVGPDSPFGRRSGRGLNENLGREILELHTLSPAAGYTQGDVTEFSRMLTGLGVEQTRDPRGTVFRPANHQPGEKTLLGKTFPPGEASIDAALEWLAAHPATHRHLARKLARHFVADDPPPEAVERLYGVLRDTGGDLGAVSRELVAMPESWDPPLGKLRSPFDVIIAAMRALGAGPERAELALNSVNLLGQPLWSPIGPNGWPDRAEDWIHAEGMMLRLDRMHLFSGLFSRRDAREALDIALGPLASEPTRLAVLRAASNREALTLLLGSPEFQRR
jgi:uncharacterized protein (DUF1800 family)